MNERLVDHRLVVIHGRHRLRVVFLLPDYGPGPMYRSMVDIKASLRAA